MIRRITVITLMFCAVTGCRTDDEAGPSAPATPAPTTPATPTATKSPAVIVDAPAAGEAEEAPEVPEITVETDAAPLTVAAATPVGAINGEPRPVIAFSRPVRPLGEREGPPPATIEPSLPGKWRWLGSTTAEFVPAGPAPRATTYTVTVAEDLHAVDGGRLAERYAYQFSTPVIRPVGGDPVKAWRAWKWVRPDETFTVIFDQRPDEKSLREHLFIAKDDGTRVPIKVLSVGPVPKDEGDAERLDEAVDRRAQVKFQPATPLAGGTAWSLVFGPGLGSAEGPLRREQGVAWKFETYGPLATVELGCAKWHGTCADGPLTLGFTNPVTAKALQAALKIEPAVAIDWPAEDDSDRPQWYLNGAFAPASSYQVRLTGLQDVFGQALPDTAFVFETGDYEPYLEGPDNQALLEKGQRAALPVSHVNRASVQLGWARLGVADAIRYLREPWQKADPPGMKWGEHALGGERNKRARTPLDVSPFVEGPGDGQIAMVRLRWGDPKHPDQSNTVVQVSDLAVHGKISPNDAYVWVWRMSDGQPVAGATVQLRDQEGQALAIATTDAGGVAQLPGVDKLEYAGKKPNESNWGPPFLVAEVRAGDDVSLTELASDWSLAPYRFGVDSTWEDAPPRAEGLVFADRGIYRPGEKVYLKAILRERRSGALVTPAGRVVKLKITDPDGAAVGEQSHTLSKFGGFDTAFDLPAEGKLGWYSFEVSDPADKISWSTSVRMAEYRAPKFLVEVRPTDAARYTGQPVRAQVEGRYLFGAAMRGADVSWSMVASAGAFEPKDADGYAFGKQVQWWDDDGGDTRLVASGQGALSAEGALAVEAGAAETPKDRPQIYTVEAAVTDVDRQVMAGRASFPVHPASFYVGVRGPRGFAQVGAPFDVSVIARSAADEARVAASQVKVKLIRHTWQTVKKKNTSGNFETVSEELKEEVGGCTVDVPADAAAKCALEASASGYHEIVTEATDGEGRVTVTSDRLWVVGMGYAAWLTDDDNRIDVVSDKASYDVGDTARLLVQSPFPKAEAWVTVEREGVLWQKRMRLEGTATPIEIPVTEAFIPNAYVSVILARPRVSPGGVPGDPGRPTFRIGYRELRVVKAPKRLAVTVRPDAVEKRPGDDLSIAVSVLDFKGQGAEAEVAVWAVDKGVLALTGYEAPDPIEALYRRRGSSVRNATNLTNLVAQLDFGEKGRPAGGGGGEGADALSLRRNFVTTPIFVGAAVTDAAGQVTVTGKLPDNLTTFTLMAVAVTAGDRAGHGTSEVIVNKPLMAQPALPRAARAGDRFLAGVVLHAAGSAATQVTVTASADGPVELLDAATREVTVPAGAGLEVRFPFAATGVGDAKLRFVAVGGGQRDAVEATVPLRTPDRLQTVAVYGDAVLPVEEALAKPGGIRPDEGGLTINLASSVLAGLTSAGQQLIEYPYGCLEQRTSRLIPLVAFKALLEKHGESLLGTRQAAEVVAENIGVLAQMQRPDGGFGYWPGSSYSHYWGTAYAALAISEIEKAGYPIPGIDLDAAYRYLREQWRSEPGSLRRRHPESQALALYVLARAGLPEPGLEAQLYEQRETLASFGQALLAAALARPGQPMKRAQALVTGLLNQAVVEAGTARIGEVTGTDFSDIFHSSTVTDAVALQALLAVDPEHVFVPRLARGLLEGRRGPMGFNNTQAAGFALLALSDYSRVREADSPAFEAQVKRGDKLLASAKFEARSLDVSTQFIKMADVPPGAAPFTFAPVGNGRLYYSARMQFAPAELPEDPEDQGIVVQRWISPVAGGGRVRAVNEGELVEVHLRIATPKLRHYVAVEDPLPAGLEPVDASLATSVQAPAPRGDEEEEAAPSWYSIWTHTEVRDDRVLLFADEMPAGIHVHTYLARATTAGTFVMPPARAEEMYSPEVWGASEGGQFWVHPKTELAGR